MRQRTCVDGASECVASENCSDFYFYCGTTLREGEIEIERERESEGEDASQITFSTLAFGALILLAHRTAKSPQHSGERQPSTVQ